MKLYNDFIGSKVLIVFELTELSRRCSKWIINILQLFQLMIKLPIESLDLYLKGIQENFVYKEPCFERKMKSKIKLNCEHLFLTCYTRNKYKLENKIFFLILPKCSRMRIQ